jgi:hypothetical protein
VTACIALASTGRVEGSFFTVQRCSPCPTKMPAEIKKEIELEIAHVLFIDIVGYSKLSINDQHARRLRN